MPVLIAYKNNPGKKPVIDLLDEPIHLVLARDMAEARFICEGYLKDCATNIFEGSQVKKWVDPGFPWDSPINGIKA